MKLAERVQVVALLRRHPGWSDHRIADQVGVHHSTVAQWRRDAQLAPYTTNVNGRRRRGIV